MAKISSIFLMAFAGAAAVTAMAGLKKKQQDAKTRRHDLASAEWSGAPRPRSDQAGAARDAAITGIR
jgi:hypothetical protein